MHALTIQMTKCYVVFDGWVPGVYDKWEDCHRQVNKFSGNNYKGYATREEAVARWRDHRRKNNQMLVNRMVVLPLILLTVIALVLYMML